MGRSKKQPALCTGPDCTLPAYCRGLCRAHYAYARRHEGEPLLPVRAPGAPLVSVSMRVSEHCAAAVRVDLSGARAALEDWARKREEER